MMAEMLWYSTTVLLCGVETHEAASPSSQLPMAATVMERNTGFVFLSLAIYHYVSVKHHYIKNFL